jgi:hypothetical protein
VVKPTEHLSAAAILAAAHNGQREDDEEMLEMTLTRSETETMMLGGVDVVKMWKKNFKSVAGVKKR